MSSDHANHERFSYLKFQSKILNSNLMNSLIPSKHPTTNTSSIQKKSSSSSSEALVFDFFENMEEQVQKDPEIQKKQSKYPKYHHPSTLNDSQIKRKDQEHILHIDLTENPTYLMNVYQTNGFVWNEEVILSPQFSSSFSEKSSYQSSWNNDHHSYTEEDSHRIFNSHVAEQLRRNRIQKETLVAEIRIDDDDDEQDKI